jgi:hypothetical protein
LHVMSSGIQYTTMLGLLSWFPREPGDGESINVQDYQVERQLARS